MEIREVRSQWQSYRQELMRADYNHADEVLARAIYFADNTPIVRNVLTKLRQTQIYKDFNTEGWLSGRSMAGCSGCGQTNLGFSLEEQERAAQSLKVLELAVNHFKRGGDGLWKIGLTTYGGSSSKIADHVQSAVDNIFNPFYSYVDKELRVQETLITPVDIMNQIQDLVDTEASIRYPETNKLLVDAYKQLFTLSAKPDGAWNVVGYKCRDTMIAFAKEVFEPRFMPEEEAQPKDDDVKSKLKYTARFHLKENGCGEMHRGAIENIIEANWEFINNLGHRRDTSESDARLGVIYTYLTIWVVDNEIKSQKNIAESK
ncbi:MAG: hypothetical protein WB392_15265 [Methanotrichaceae archaeon]